MEKHLSYESYLNSLLDISEQIQNEETSKSTIDQKERNAVSNIENDYLLLSEELQNAKNAVSAQYKSVWESCTKNAGLKIPQEQRPAATSLSWKEAVRVQEQAASKIQDWFTMKSQRAILERQKKLREEEAQKAAIAAAQAEAIKRRAEEAARAERERGEAIIEAMKQKHRKSF